MKKIVTIGSLVLLSVLLVTGGFWLYSQRVQEKLFFALQIEDQGLVVARPKLVGAAGHPLSLRMPDLDHPEQSRLEVVLEPERKGDSYAVALDVSLNGNGPRHSRGSVKLHHAEERQLQLPGGHRPLSVKLLVMRVDSPEFQAYMKLAQDDLLKSAS